MIKSLFFLFLFFCSLQSFSQKLVYKSNGNITDSENQKISPDQVRELLKNNKQLLADYSAGRTKKTVGNIMLYGGLGLFFINTISVIYNPNSNWNDNNYNNGNDSFVLSYIGLASVVASIPVKIGFSKKIKNVVTEYNNQASTANNQLNNQKLDIITNSNGIGLRLTLN